MFDPPPEMHTRFEAALSEVRGPSGAHLLTSRARTSRPSAFHKTNPAITDWLLGSFAQASAEHVDAAMRAASDAFPPGARRPAERIRLLRRVAQLIEERVYHIAAAVTLEVGKNRMEALGEVQETADFFSVYCDSFEHQGGFDHALPNDPLPNVVSRNRSVMKPYGAWVVINPFNFPFALAGGPVAAALVTGNTVVLKGASETPWSGRLLADCLRDAGLPPGVFNYLMGPGAAIGESWCRIRKPAASRSPAPMKRAWASCVPASRPFPKPCIAEMGGKNACVVTANADLDPAAAGIVRSAFGMGGQKCSALSRLYVDESVADGLMERLLAQIRRSASAIRRRENWLGPVVTRAATTSTAATYATARHGARILCGGDKCGRTSSRAGSTGADAR